MALKFIGEFRIIVKINGFKRSYKTSEDIGLT